MIDAKGALGGMGILWNPEEVNLSGFVAIQFSLSTDFHIVGIKIKGFMTNVFVIYGIFFNKLFLNI